MRPENRGGTSRKAQQPGFFSSSIRITVSWKIEFSNRAEKQLRKLDKQVGRRILKYLKNEVEPDPESAGKFLKGNLAELRRYRVGDYRIICALQDQKLIVLVLEIGHRSDV